MINKKKLRKWGLVLIFFLAVIGIGLQLLKSDFFLKQMEWEKIWVHRTNSRGILAEVNHTYAGVETDVDFFDSLGKFDINHPPAQSIGLDLYDFLKANNNKNLKFWLDMKNLRVENDSIEFSKLDSIVNLLGYHPENFIIESGDPSSTFIFLQHGYKTSYYLHWPGLYTLGKKELNLKLASISKNIKEHPTTYISSPWWDYQILKENFPDKEKLLWFAVAELPFSNFVQKHLYRLKVAKDPKVKVILMDVKTRTPFR